MNAVAPRPRAEREARPILRLVTHLLAHARVRRHVRLVWVAGVVGAVGQLVRPWLWWSRLLRRQEHDERDHDGTRGEKDIHGYTFDKSHTPTETPAETKTENNPTRRSVSRSRRASFRSASACSADRFSSIRSTRSATRRSSRLWLSIRAQRR